MKNKKGLLEFVEAGHPGFTVPIPDGAPEELEVRLEDLEEECPHEFSLRSICNFLDGKLSLTNEKVMKQQINSCEECKEEARRLTVLEGREDELFKKMGWE